MEIQLRIRLRRRIPNGLASSFIKCKHCAHKGKECAPWGYSNVKSGPDDKGGRGRPARRQNHSWLSPKLMARAREKQRAKPIG